MTIRQTKMTIMMGVAAMIMPTTGWAQQDGADADAGFGGEILVTARRAEENIQSVPVSITAFNADALREAGISSTADLMMKTPGVFLGGSGGRENSNFAIRGQAKALAGNSASAVVSYFAEVPMPTFGSGMPTFDISSVQVLKGPQGTLFGRNTTGGAILFYPTAPDYEIGGYVQGTYGSYDNVELEGALTLPIVNDHVSLRVAGKMQKRDGYTHNIGNGGDLDDADSKAFRVSLLLEPTDWLKNTTIYDYYRSRTAGDASVLVSVNPGASPLSQLSVRTAALAEFAAQQARGPRVVNTDVDQYSRVNRTGLTNRTEIDLGAAQIINIFGYRSTRLAYLASSDGFPTLISDGTGAVPAGLPVTVVNGSLFSDVDQYSNELQLRGSAMDDRLDWLVGGFYLKSSPQGPSGTYIPIFKLTGITDAPSAYNFYTEKSRAAFANLQFEITDGLKLNGGLRYTKDNISACVGNGLNNKPEVTPAECNSAAPTIRNSSINKTSSKAWTYQVGLDWQATDDVFAYAVTRKGYRAGGVNSPTLAGRLAPFQTFAPETVQDIEVGAKTEFRAGDVRMRFNASAFVGWYKGVQVPLSGVNTPRNCVVGGAAPISPDGDCNPDNDPSGGTLLVNAGKSRVSGLDFSGVIAPMESLSFSFGGTLLKPKSLSVSLPTDLDPYLANKQVPFNYAAKKTFNLGARWELPTPEALGQAVFSIDYYYSGKINHSDLVLPSYDLVNARFDVNKIAGTGLDFAIFAQNLFDAKYLAGGNVGSAVLGAMSAIYGAPQTFGVQLRYKFGQ